jgi:hypothetical protein
MNSILKAMSWTMPSDFIPVDEQSKSTLQSCLWELFLHVDSEWQFNKCKMHLESWMWKHFSMDPIDCSFPNYWKIASAMGFTGELFDTNHPTTSDCGSHEVCGVCV